MLRGRGCADATLGPIRLHCRTGSGQAVNASPRGCRHV